MSRRRRAPVARETSDVLRGRGWLLVSALVFAAVLPPSLVSTTLAITIAWWPWYTRLLRGQAASVAGRPYVESARALEPLADDLASLGLDVLVGEEGFARVANPFVLGVMAEPDGNN